MFVTLDMFKKLIKKNNKKLIDNIKINNQINYAQKTVNTQLDSVHCVLESNYTPVAGEYVPFVAKSGNMGVTDGKVTVKPGQRVQIDISLSYADKNNDSYANIEYIIKDFTNNIDIQVLNPYRVDKLYEYSYSTVAQYTNNTNVDCQIGLYVASIFSLDIIEYKLTSFTVHEIGRQIAIDPVEYINTEQGIEDTPVGHILSVMSNKAPNHYLACDGKQYNISDYPYLAQYFIDEFGIVNHFGGDGETTFAVPDLRGTGENVDETQNNYEISAISTNTSVLYCIKYEPTYFMNVNSTVNTGCAKYELDKEIVVGKWIDGKPIYRKVIKQTITKMKGLTSIISLSELQNISINSIRGYAIRSDGELLELNTSITTDGTADISLSITCFIDKTQGLAIKTYSAVGSSLDTTIVLEYTKTTDEPNSFKEDMIYEDITNDEVTEEDIQEVFG